MKDSGVFQTPIIPGVKMGTLTNIWREGETKNITFSVTQECNLRCTYCYMKDKNSDHRMTLESAAKAVDYILTNRDDFDTPAVVWEFIGGEPLIEIDLIDQISEYIKFKMYELNHPWFHNYMFFMCSNGLLYGTKKVQDYIARNRSHVSIGLSVDGNKVKHDLSRIKLDGSGSYDDVMKNVPLWLEQFPNTMTKATFSHDDLPYLCDSIISLWDNGIKTVAANVIFEDVWHPEDPDIYEDQLKRLADYIIDRELWNDYSVRFFEPTNGFALDNSLLNMPHCGTGRMLAIDSDGNFYPCVRFLESCQTGNNSRDIGNIHEGLNHDKIRPFLAMNVGLQSAQTCIDCDVASGCANCTAFDFESSENGTIFFRATFICNMHKASVRANKYFWEKWSQKNNAISPRDLHLASLTKNRDWMIKNSKFMYFIMKDDITPHCAYSPIGNKTMDEINFNQGIDFCRENNFIPIFLGDHNQLAENYLKNHFGYKINSNSDANNHAQVFYNEINEDIHEIPHSQIAILNISSTKLDSLHEMFLNISKFYSRINLVIQNVELLNNNDLEKYQSELQKIKESIISHAKTGHLIELNVLTDAFMNENLEDCKAGVRSFAFAPDGQIYACPAFYYEKNTYGKICSIDEKNFNSLIKKYSARLPLCSQCDANHCKVCRIMNLKCTGEYNFPSEKQCKLTMIETNISRSLSKDLENEKLLKIVHPLEAPTYEDPLQRSSYYLKRKSLTL